MKKLNKRQKRIKHLFVNATVLTLLSCSNLDLSEDKIEIDVLSHNLSFLEEHDLNIVAHRGFSGRNADNSKKSINDAYDSNCVDMIEIDIRETKDNEFILSHDSFVKIYGLPRKIENTNLNTILNQGSRSMILTSFEQVNSILKSNRNSLEKVRNIKKLIINEEFLSLDELLEYYNFDKPLIIDIKSNLSIKSIEKLFNKLYNYNDNIIIQSSNLNNLLLMKTLYPSFSYSAIIDSNKDLDYLNSFDNYTVHYSMINKVPNNDNSKYFIWLVGEENYSKVMKLVKRFSIDNCYFITDNPDILCTMYEKSKVR